MLSNITPISYVRQTDIGCALAVVHEYGDAQGVMHERVVERDLSTKHSSKQAAAQVPICNQLVWESCMRQSDICGKCAWTSRRPAAQMVTSVVAVPTGKMIPVVTICRCSDAHDKQPVSSRKTGALLRNMDEVEVQLVLYTSNHRRSSCQPTIVIGLLIHRTHLPVWQWMTILNVLLSTTALVDMRPASKWPQTGYSQKRWDLQVTTVSELRNWQMSLTVVIQRIIRSKMSIR